MTKQTRAKQERIVEAVRRGLEGDAAVEFVRNSGYAMTVAGIARHLRSMGGRGAVQSFLNEGKTNKEILEVCFPDDDLSDVPIEPPRQPDLFVSEAPPASSDGAETHGIPLYETRKMSIKLPADLYEAIRVAAKAEGLGQNQLIVDILTSALSRMPLNHWDHPSNNGGAEHG